jgi:hypothetical protein
MFKGDIDNLCIYNYALSADEVSTLYNNACDIKSVTTEATIVKTTYYTLNGVSHDTPQLGINIVRTLHADGSYTVKKVIITKN